MENVNSEQKLLINLIGGPCDGLEIPLSARTNHLHIPNAVRYRKVLRDGVWVNVFGAINYRRVSATMFEYVCPEPLQAVDRN